MRINKEMGQENLTDIVNNLNERTKELNCIYELNEVLSDLDQDEDTAIKNLIAIIPKGWRFTDICKVYITYRDKVFTSEGYKNTELKQTAKIIIDGKIEGNIIVVYIKPLRTEKGIFLREELTLLNTIAAKISNFLLLKQLRRTIKDLENNDVPPVAVPLKESEKVISWLKSLSLRDEEIEKFMRVQIKFKKGETMCKQGSLTSYIMLLSEGLSKNYLEGGQERGFNFSIVKPFDFIGLSSLYGSSLYYFSGAALTNCNVYIIENSVFKNIADKNQEFANYLFRWYCITTERHLKRLSCIANKQALGRIAEILLYLKENIFESNMIKGLISRKDIAELAAMSTESAVRILSDLKKDNIINMVGNDIEIADEKMLRTLSIAG
jgi:CRP-like cAMP-binding protein